MKKILLAGVAISLYASNSVEVMLSSLKFNYKEYVNSTYLDGDSSSFSKMLGLKVSLTQKIKKFKLDEKFEYNRGETHYDGSTWGGTPLSLTKKNVNLLNAKLIASYLMMDDETSLGSGQFYLSAGLGYRRWNRGKSDYVGDYNEKYYWPYYLVGANIDETFGKVGLGIGYYYHKAINPKMKADLNGGNTYDLGKTSGYRIVVPLKYKIAQNYGVLLEYVYDYWKINKSNIIDGTYEPDSKTKNQYLNMGFYYNF